VLVPCCDNYRLGYHCNCDPCGRCVDALWSTARDYHELKELCPLTDRQAEALLLLRQVSREALIDVADYLQDDADFHHEIVLDADESAASAALAAFVRELARGE